MSRSSWWYAVAGVAALVAAAALAWRYLHPPDPPPVAPLSFETMDQLMSEIAHRAVGGAQTPDYRIAPTKDIYPIGTLILPNTSDAEDDAACRVATEPPAYGKPNLVFTFDAPRAVLGDIGVDPGRALPNIKLSAASSARITASIEEPQGIILTRAAVRALLKQPDCQRALAGRKMLLVRGYVVGKRNFAITTEGNVDLGAAVTRVGSFDVKKIAGDRISVTDATPQRFLQVISEIDTAATTAGVPALEQPSAAAPNAKGRIYVHRDQRDASTAGRNAVAVLVATFGDALPVERIVEPIRSDKMPDRPQVRYFNEADRTTAAKAADVLQSKLGTPFAVVRIGLPAPAGQLEVWLQRQAPRPSTKPPAHSPEVATCEIGISNAKVGRGTYQACARMLVGQIRCSPNVTSGLRGRWLGRDFDVVYYVRDGRLTYAIMDGGPNVSMGETKLGPSCQVPDFVLTKSTVARIVDMGWPDDDR